MRGLDLLAILLGILLFGLIGSLWYLRPGSVLWLLGSLAWACVSYPAFMWYVTRSR
jgi:hypothetical protein